MYVCVCVCVYVYVYVCMYTYTYVHVYMYIYICIHTSPYAFLQRVFAFIGDVEPHACAGVYVRQML